MSKITKNILKTYYENVVQLLKKIFRQIYSLKNKKLIVIFERDQDYNDNAGKTYFLIKHYFASVQKQTYQ